MFIRAYTHRLLPGAKGSIGDGVGWKRPTSSYKPSAGDGVGRERATTLATTQDVKSLDYGIRAVVTFTTPHFRIGQRLR